MVSETEFKLALKQLPRDQRLAVLYLKDKIDETNSRRIDFAEDQKTELIKKVETLDSQITNTLANIDKSVQTFVNAAVTDMAIAIKQNYREELFRLTKNILRLLEAGRDLEIHVKVVEKPADKLDASDFSKESFLPDRREIVWFPVLTAMDMPKSLLVSAQYLDKSYWFPKGMRDALTGKEDR